MFVNRQCPVGSTPRLGDPVGMLARRGRKDEGVGAVAAFGEAVGERDVLDGDVAGVGEEDAGCALGVDGVAAAVDDQRLRAAGEAQHRQRLAAGGIRHQRRQVDVLRQRDGVGRVAVGVRRIDRGGKLVGVGDGETGHRALRWCDTFGSGHIGGRPAASARGRPPGAGARCVASQAAARWSRSGG